MSRSGAEAGPATEPGGSELRPRYGRIAMLGASVLVTVTTVLGGLGVLPAGGGPSYAAGRDNAVTASLSAVEQHASDDPSVAATAAPAPEPDAEDLALPADSGEGRRVVFDQGAQRVWLVKADGSVARTYPISGSMYDNLDPGTYSVYSRSPRAWGVDDSGTMRYMVRFAHGTSASIGFHDIPVLDGKRVQSRADLGTPLSHGCVRQWRPDAKALWDFAPLGTTVVVVDSSAGSSDSPGQSEG